MGSFYWQSFLFDMGSRLDATTVRKGTSNSWTKLHHQNNSPDLSSAAQCNDFLGVFSSLQPIHLHICLLN